MRRIWNGTAAIGVCLALGCHSGPNVLDVSSHYSGDIVIHCVHRSSEGQHQTIHVDDRGYADTTTCPKAESTVVIEKNGQQIEPQPKLVWYQTGDDILSLRFTIP